MNANIARHSWLETSPENLAHLLVLNGIFQPVWVGGLTVLTGCETMERLFLPLLLHHRVTFWLTLQSLPLLRAVFSVVVYAWKNITQNI